MRQGALPSLGRSQWLVFELFLIRRMCQPCAEGFCADTPGHELRLLPPAGQKQPSWTHHTAEHLDSLYLKYRMFWECRELSFIAINPIYLHNQT